MMKKAFYLALCTVLGAGPACFAQGEDGGSADSVTCVDQTLKIDAASVKPEDLIRQIGEQCCIKIVIYGEAFEDKPIGVKFQRLPVRKGIERVMRIANLSNFVLHFDNATVNPRIVELDIMGKKGGERQLTAGSCGKGSSAPAVASVTTTTARSIPAPPAAPSKPAETRSPALDKRPTESKPAIEPKDMISEKNQEEFMRVMDEMMKAQENGEEPDPAEVLRIFKEVVPPEVREQIPPDVLKEIEEFEKNPQAFGGADLPAGPRRK